MSILAKASCILLQPKRIGKDIVHMSMPPTMEAKAYQTMYVNGNHIHGSNVEEH
jgi:hypothetical protein